MKIIRMPIKDPNNYDWTVVISLLVMTLLGGITKYFCGIKNGDKFNVWSLLAQMLVSAFAGSLIFFIASYFSWDFEVAGGISGLAGWSGATSIKAFEDRLVKKASGRDDYRGEQ